MRPCVPCVYCSANLQGEKERQEWTQKKANAEEADSQMVPVEWFGWQSQLKAEPTEKTGVAAVG